MKSMMEGNVHSLSGPVDTNSESNFYQTFEVDTAHCIPAEVTMQK